MSLYEDMRGIRDMPAKDVIGGIVTGIVKENYSKDAPGMVKVELFLGEEGRNVTGWIPVMTPYGGAEHGLYALPEVGAEVVVAFNMGDRNRPIVIGCLWSGKNKQPPQSVTEKNLTKTFLTKGGNQITVDDTDGKQKMTLLTKNGKGIELDEEKDSITLHDKDSKNSIVIDSKKGEITVTADKKLTLKAGSTSAVLDGSGSKLVLKSTTVEVSADKDLKLKGQDSSLEGTMLKLKGASSLQAESSGTTQVKGTIVKIN